MLEYFLPFWSSFTIKHINADNMLVHILVILIYYKYFPLQFFAAPVFLDL